MNSQTLPEKDGRELAFCLYFWGLLSEPLHVRPVQYLPVSENSTRLWLSEIPCWKSFPANFDAAGKLFPDFPAARHAIPAKFSAFSGKENGCWKIGRLRERSWIFSSETATAFLSFSECRKYREKLKHSLLKGSFDKRVRIDWPVPLPVGNYLVSARKCISITQHAANTLKLGKSPNLVACFAAAHRQRFRIVKVSLRYRRSP